MKPLRVLSVCTSDSYGGAGRAAFRIQEAVRELGVDSRMFVKHKGTGDSAVLTVDDFIPHNAFYKGFDWARNKVKNKCQHYLWGKYPDRQKFFMSDLRSTDIGHALQKIDYDILHLHWINLRFLPLDQLPKDRPIVWTLHDSWPFCGICHVPLGCDGYTKQCGSCPMLRSSDSDDLSHRVWEKKKKILGGLDLHIVAPSRWMADNARKSTLFAGRDIRVIPNCIDTELFSPGERDEACGRLHLDTGKRHVLFGAIGAHSDTNKGLSYLVESFSHLDDRLKEGIDLVIVGMEGTNTDLIPGITVHNLGILRDERDMASAYRAADLTVVPSLSENLSCTIMESLSCGTPVNAFAIGGNGDLVDHKVNGYLSREKDSSDFADGIRWCLENAKDISAAARSKVLQCYTPAEVGKEYAGLYQSLTRPCF